jgi:hypothetical protein
MHDVVLPLPPPNGPPPPPSPLGTWQQTSVLAQLIALEHDATKVVPGVYAPLGCNVWTNCSVSISGPPPRERRPNCGTTTPSLAPVMSSRSRYDHDVGMDCSTQRAEPADRERRHAGSYVWIIDVLFWAVMFFLP